MSLDRFIRFEDITKIPSLNQLQILVEDFLGEIKSITNKDNWMIITLNGKPSDPFKRILNRNVYDGEERWIEIHIGTKSIDVITRQQDPFTNSVARGLTKTIATFWDGELDMED